MVVICLPAASLTGSRRSASPRRRRGPCRRRIVRCRSRIWCRSGRRSPGSPTAAAYPARRRRSNVLPLIVRFAIAFPLIGPIHREDPRAQLDRNKLCTNQENAFAARKIIDPSGVASPDWPRRDFLLLPSTPRRSTRLRLQRGHIETKKRLRAARGRRFGRRGRPAHRGRAQRQ